MSGGGWGLVVAVVLSLAISEFSELSPWLAQKLIRWAAQVRYPTRVEELSALIAERPGKLFKLVTASGFACAALTYRVTHRKAEPVRSVTSRLWIVLASELVAGILLTSEMMLVALIANIIPSYFVVSNIWFPYFIIWSAIAAFATAAEFLVPSRLPAGWAIGVVSFALLLISSVVLNSVLISSVVGKWVPRFHFESLILPGGIESLILPGGMAAVAGVSAACAIRLGNRLRFPAIAASSTILGCGFLTFEEILMRWSTDKPQYVVNLVMQLGYGFALGSSVGVGVLLGRVLCGRRLSQPSAPHTVT